MNDQHLHPRPLAAARAIEGDLKRTLYGCFERLNATKAALYLAVTNNDESAYELVTSYAYNPAGRQSLDGRDAVVKKLLTMRKPLIINAVGSDRHIGEILFRQQNERMLAVPIFGRMRRIVGFVDLRDKAGSKPFDDRDVAAAEKVVEEIGRVLAKKELYGVGPVPLVDPPPRRRVSSRMRLAAVAPRESGSQSVQADTLSARAQSIVTLARQRMERRDPALDGRRRVLTDQDVENIRVFLPAALALPSAVAGVLTVVGELEKQVFVARGEIDQATIKLLREKIAHFMRRGDEALTVEPLVWPAGKSGKFVVPDRVRIVANALLAPRLVEGLILTVAFEATPDAEMRAQFLSFVDRFGEAIAAMLGRTDWAAQRHATAEALLEPDFQKFPGLADHCRLTSGIAQRFAKVLGLPDDQAEKVRIAALVHDVGLRLLDYDRLAKRTRLTEEHMKAMMDHPLVGAMLVEPMLGTEIAEAVLHHHERWDGTGYPRKLAGERIPLVSRIIQIADVWAAITSPWSYEKIASPSDAERELRQGAGKQFDPGLVERFLGAIDQVSS
ncbi:MAG TPA: HD domain-containing phosphohydrolase [Thermoanaerobaculia bacterium]|nr:HD domain-containing phosphohydrolase [Thermoanaerobaculia bacterium]